MFFFNIIKKRQELFQKETHLSIWIKLDLGNGFNQFKVFLRPFLYFFIPLFCIFGQTYKKMKNKIKLGPLITFWVGGKSVPDVTNGEGKTLTFDNLLGGGGRGGSLYQM